MPRTSTWVAVFVAASVVTLAGQKEPERQSPETMNSLSNPIDIAACGPERTEAVLSARATVPTGAPAVPVDQVVTTAPATRPPVVLSSASANAAPQQVPAGPTLPARQTLPTWLVVSGQYRGRIEAMYNTPGVTGPFYLNRFRLDSRLALTSSVLAVVQIQDARVASYEAAAPASMQNVVDLNEIYVVVGNPKRHRWSVRAGRQPVLFGDQRFFTGADWANAARSVDAVRTGWTQGNVTLTSVVARPVIGVSDAFDRPNDAEFFTVSMLTWRHEPTGVLIEPSVMTKQLDPAAGATQGTTLYTYGTRAVGKVPGSFDYNVEVTLQRGHSGSEPVTASAQHYQLGWTAADLAWRPRVAIDLNFASGDSDPADGRRETFDQLYGANHGRFGLVDRIAWRNMAHVGVLTDMSPRKAVKVKAGVHRLFLAEAVDGLYASASGARAAVQGPVTSSHVGDAVDVLVAIDVMKQTTISLGAGYLFAGTYTKQSLRAGDMWTPHVTWRLTF